MTTTLGIFTKQLVCLSEVLSKRFPESKEIKLAYTGIKQLNNMNKKKLMEFFLGYAYKYKKQVEEADENFLINYDYNEFADEAESFDIIKSLKDNWHQLEKEEKESIWKYLQVLMVLTDKYKKEKNI